MRTMSPKRRRSLKGRQAVEAELFEEAPWCARCGKPTEVHGHEFVSGGVADRSKPDVMLCNPCNTWAEDHPAEARDAGWKLPKSSQRHVFAPDGVGFYCERCSLPLMNWRHK